MLHRLVDSDEIVNILIWEGVVQVREANLNVSAEHEQGNVVTNSRRRIDGRCMAFTDVEVVILRSPLSYYIALKR